MFPLSSHDPAQSKHVGDSYLQRDGRNIPGDDSRRAVALALGAAVAGAGDVHGGGAVLVDVVGACSVLSGDRGAG